MEVGNAAFKDGDELAGASERQPKRSGGWNKFDDAAAAGIFAAARAAGASGAGIRYGDVHFKVWFKLQGEEAAEVSERINKLQLATADARLAELERRNASQSTRAQKERQRKVKQKAAKKAAMAEQQPGTRSAPVTLTTTPKRPSQQGMHGQRQRMQAKEMAGGERAAAGNAASLTAASMEHPATSRVKRTARLDDKAWQVIVPNGTKAATMSEQQLGRALSGERDEQQRATWLHLMMQPAEGPPAKSKAAAKTGVSPAGHQPMDTQPVEAAEDMGFALYDE